MRWLPIIAALAATSASAAPLTMSAMHPDDPESIWMEWDLETGRVSFSKPGDYLGEKLGETCAWTVGGLDPHFECSPLSSDSETFKVTPMRAWGAATREDADQSRYLLSAGKSVSAVFMQTWPSGLIGLQTEKVGDVLVRRFESVSIHAPALNPTTVPLPASFWLLLLACAALFRWRSAA